jgi:hypothetical protein
MLPISPYELEANQIANRGHEVGKKLWQAVYIKDIHDPLATFSNCLSIIADQTERDYDARELFALAARHAIRDVTKETLELFEREFNECYWNFVKEKENVGS